MCLIIITMLPADKNPGTVIVKKPTIRNSAIKVRSFNNNSRIFSREREAPPRGASATDCVIFILEPLSAC